MEGLKSEAKHVINILTDSFIIESHSENWEDSFLINILRLILLIVHSVLQVLLEIVIAYLRVVALDAIRNSFKSVKNFPIFISKLVGLENKIWLLLGSCQQYLDSYVYSKHLIRNLIN